MNAQEIKEAGHGVVVVFDGGGTEILATFADPDHNINGLLGSLRDNILGACRNCATVPGVKEQITQANFNLLGDYKGHASLLKLFEEGYQVINHYRSRCRCAWQNNSIG